MKVSCQICAPAHSFHGQEPSEPITQYWVDTRTDPDVFKKRQIPCPCQESIHDSSVVHLCIELALNDRKIRR